MREEGREREGGREEGRKGTQARPLLEPRVHVREHPATHHGNLVDDQELQVVQVLRELLQVLAVEGLELPRGGVHFGELEQVVERPRPLPNVARRNDDLEATQRGVKGVSFLLVTREVAP